MFDIGFFELLLVGIVTLLVVGPERLPDAVRTTARWWSGLKRTLHNAREELEKEIGADDIRRELHNERIMRELEDSRREMEQAIGNIGQEVPQRETSQPQPHPTAEAEDYLPEEDENAEDLQDPEYPEHWHDFGDPEFNEHHPDHFVDEVEEVADVEKEEPPKGKDSQS